VRSLQATQAAARQQVAAIRGAESQDDGWERSMLSTSASSGAAAEAHMSAMQAAEEQKRIDERMAQINAEYAQEVNAHKANMPNTHRSEFDEFSSRLRLSKESQQARSLALHNSMHMPVPKPVAHKPEPVQTREEQVAQMQTEMAGEPVTMFLEESADVEDAGDADSDADADADADTDFAADADSLAETEAQLMAEMDDDLSAFAMSLPQTDEVTAPALLEQPVLEVPIIE